MSEPDDPLQQTIAALRAEFASHLPGRIDEIERLWQHLAAGDAPRAAAEGAPQTALDDLIRAAHGIAGAGAVFGFAAAGKAARELEQFLERLREGMRPAGRPADAAERERVDGLIAALRNLAAQPR